MLLARPLAAAPGYFGAASSVKAWRKAWALRRTLRKIEDLSDRELWDIGLSGGDPPRASRRSFLADRLDARNVGRDQLPM